MSIKENWKTVSNRVASACKKAGRQPEEVKIVAVSKKKTAEEIIEAYHAGARHFGENYVQEALPKIEKVENEISGKEIHWHFIGKLQSKKAKQVVGTFEYLHSLDRLSLVKSLEKRGASLHALVEINIAGEETKGGVSPDHLRPFLEQISSESNIHVVGLMSFPPYAQEAERSRSYFERSKELFEEAKGFNLARIEMNELSMGVTSDFEVAIECGATLVRIGTAIFGAR